MPRPHPSPRAQAPWTTAETGRLADLHRRGLDDRAIATRLGRTACAIRQKRGRLGLTCPGRRPWSPAEVARLRRLARQGLRAAQIAERLDRTTEAVLATFRRHGLSLRLERHRGQQEGRS